MMEEEKTPSRKAVPCFTEERLNEIIALQKYARQVAKKEFFYNLMSAQVNDLAKAMSEFKKSFKEMKTDKVAGGRYKYQSLPALLHAISPGLAKHGLCCLQPVHTIADKTYVITMILHSSGQYIRSVTALPEKYTMAGKVVNTFENLQAMGGALTYTKRHALKSMLGIDADEDSDGNSPYTARSNGYGN